MNVALDLSGLLRNFRSIFGDITTYFLNVAKNPDEDISGALAALADSEQGGILIVQFEEHEHHLAGEDYFDDGDPFDDAADDAPDDEDDPDEQDHPPFDQYQTLFPILEHHQAKVAEGKLWIALVAGTVSAPGHKPTSPQLLRAGELSPVLNADLTELQLNLIGIHWRPNAPEKTRYSNLAKLARLGIVTERNGTVYPTVAGMIALGKRPHAFLPGMRVVLEIEGKEVHWRGSLTWFAENALSMSEPCMQPMLREFRELLLNAVLHRDWRLWCRSTPIRITVSGASLTVTHPGRLHPEWRVGKSSPTNPTLHALACLLNVARGRGVGLQRTDSRLVALQLPPMTLSSRQGMVQQVIPWQGPAPLAVRTSQPGRTSAPTASPVQTQAVAPQPPRVHTYLSTPSPQPRPSWMGTPGSSTAPTARPTAPALGHHVTAPSRPATSVPAAPRIPAASSSKENPKPAGYPHQPPPRATPERGAMHPPSPPPGRSSNPERLEQSTGLEWSSSSAQEEPRLEAPASPAPTGWVPQAAASAAGPQAQAEPESTPTNALAASNPNMPLRMASAQPLACALGLAADSSGEKEAALLKFLQQKGPMTAKELMNGLNCKRWTLRSVLERLIATGAIRSLAATAKSPNQKYELVR